MDRLISEKAVLEAFREYQGSISDFYKAVKAIPSAEPKTGHWIERKNIPKSVDIATANLRWKYECSECEYELRSKYHFCPNCGCCMVEPQESEEV